MPTNNDENRAPNVSSDDFELNMATNGEEEASDDDLKLVEDGEEDSKRYLSGSPLDAPPVAPPESGETYGIYGLQTPLVSESVRAAKIPQSDLFEKRKNKRDEEDDASLESIYDRKRKRLESGDDPYAKKGERVPLPDRPFRDRILKPFYSPGFLTRMAIIAGFAFIPLLCATIFFSRSLSHDVVETLEGNRNVGIFLTFFKCLWRDRVVFMLFCFVWGIFATPHSFQIFADTSEGADEIDEWPEYNFLGGLGQFLWILCLMALAGVPGGAFFASLGFDKGIGFALSSVVLTPIFYLSCTQADALFALLTKDVWRSFRRNYRSWLTFMGINFAFFFGTIILTMIALRSAIVTDPDAKLGVARACVIAGALSLFFSFIPALYLRFLGRLAWIIEDDVRRRAEEEQTEKDASARAEVDEYASEAIDPDR